MGEERTDILIVDNDDRIVELVRWFLEKRDYTVRTAATFAEATGQLEERLPVLMLSDVDLGTENALEELPRLAASGLLAPTLVVSGYLDVDLEERLTALPEVLDTLAKPFDFSVLEERIQACLARIARGEVVPHAARSAPAGPAQTADDPAAEHGWIEISPARPR